MHSDYIIALGLIAIIVSIIVRVNSGGRIRYQQKAKVNSGTTGPCISADHRVNEILNEYGAHRCKNHCQCDGERMCSSNNWCETQRPNG